jgi:hypothetical protein
LPELTPLDLFLLGHLKEDFHAVRPKAKMLRWVRDNAVWRIAVWLETDEGCYEQLLWLRGRPLFYHLKPWTRWR